jgi:AbiV family abortive infection protein
MATTTKDFLIEGACRSVAHAAQLAADAKTLLEACRSSSAFVLSVMAREELGRGNILWIRADEMKPGDALSVEQEKSLAKKLKDHVTKLDAGQSTTHYAMPAELLAKYKVAQVNNDHAALAEFHAERKRIVNDVRDADPNRTHDRRMVAQYVSFRAGLPWSDPSEVTFEEARSLLVDVAHEIGHTLMQAETNDIMSAACVRCSIALPRSEAFNSTVSWAVFEMKPVE